MYPRPRTAVLVSLLLVLDGNIKNIFVLETTGPFAIATTTAV
jgi:hypothetical protein